MAIVVAFLAILLLKFNNPAPYLDYALGVCVLLCLFSVIVCLYVRKNLVLEIKTEQKRIREGDVLRFSIRADYPEFRTVLRPRISLETLQTGDRTEVPKSLLTGLVTEYEVPGLLAGTVRLSVPVVWVSGLFGLLRLPKRILPENGTREVRVDPAPKPLREQLVRRSYLPGEGEIRNAKGDDYTELYEVRPFQEGDDLRYVHRALTAKHGEYVIKVGSDSRKPHYIYRIPETDAFEEIRIALGEIVSLRSGLLGEENCAISAQYKNHLEEVSVDSRFAAFIDRVYDDYVR